MAACRALRLEPKAEQEASVVRDYQPASLRTYSPNVNDIAHDEMYCLDSVVPEMLYAEAQLSAFAVHE